MKLYLFTALACMCLSGQARIPQSGILQGKVTCQGAGLPGVVVSDGNRCVRTDASGNYRITAAEDSRFMFISTPSGYLTDTAEGTIPLFYQEIDRSADKTYDFSLKKNPKDDRNHVCFVQADAQLTAPENLDTYRELLDDLSAETERYAENDVFGIDCGDIVGDNASLFSPYIQTVKSVNMPIYRAIGNHDMDYNGRTFETSYHTFEDYFGPACYSFNKGKAHYIVINNNFYIGREFYYIGYVNEKTFRWLEEDLAHVPKSSLVFLIMHMPSRLAARRQPFQYSYDMLADQTVNAEALHALFKEHDTHIISGHMHYNLNICFSPRLMEHNTAAVCGTWWCADICLDGTPRGYAIYKVEENRVTWEYKSSGHPANYQARAYLPGASEENPQSIIANVWNWDEQWKVEWREDGKVMGRMTRFTGYDPYAKAICQDTTKIRYSWIVPTLTGHMFRAVPRNPSAKIDVKITDRFGNVYIQPAEACPNFPVKP